MLYECVFIFFERLKYIKASEALKKRHTNITRWERKVGYYTTQTNLLNEISIYVENVEIPKKKEKKCINQSPSKLGAHFSQPHYLHL